MQRLRGRKISDDAELAFAQALLGAKKPYRPDPFMSERVEHKLRRGRRGTRRAGALRPMAVALAVLLFVSTASAMFGRSAILRGIQRLVTLGEPAREPVRPRRPPAPSMTVGAPIVTPLTAADAPLPAPNRETGNASPLKRRRSIARATESAPRDAQESAVLSKAFRALRHSRDPVRTLELVDAYLLTAPEGMLAEEAAALRVEALVVARDPAAHEAAAAYLAKFPDGRFREPAKRALELFP